MGWVVQLVETGTDRSRARGVDVLEISRPSNLGDIANLGLTLPEAKRLLARVQQAVAAAPDRDAVRRGGGAAAAVSLYWLWPHRGRCKLALALPINPGAGPAPGAP